MSEAFDTQPGMLREHRAALIACGLFVLALAVVLYLLRRGGEQQRVQSQPFQMVRVVTPPPPPPPPQKLPTPKMIQQPKITTPEIKQEQHMEASKPAALDRPLGLDAKGEGAGDGFNLAGDAGGSALLGGGGGGGSRWGWYASMVQEQIAQALRANPRTRHASFNVEISIWANGSGRIDRVRLDSSTGDPSLDKVLEDEVFPRLTLREPPPKDMPMPIVMRNVAQRPG